MSAFPGAARARLRSPWFWAGASMLIAPVNFAVWFVALDWARDTLQSALLFLFWVLALLQIVCGAVAVVVGIRHRRAVGRGGVGAAVAGFLSFCGGIAGGIFGTMLGMFAMNGGWGRPLRIRGRQRHPELRLGSDWTKGRRPDASALDEPTRAALEALWLHDAQKEHASVPAFSRISWLLAAAGAPAELLQWSHRAALEEIEHAQLCFALAAGYGGRSHTVEPMPELLLGDLGARGNVLALLATESLGDGCLLEDFNADIAAECALVCEEPATRAVLEQIAREERSHAEFSWAVVAWALQRGGADVAVAVESAIDGLERYRRPTAVSWRAQSLVGRADAVQLRRHGRLPDARWGELWAVRLQATDRRAAELLGTPAAAAAT